MPSNFNLNDTLANRLKVKNILSEMEVERGRSMAENGGISLDRALLRLGLLEERLLLPELAGALNLPFSLSEDGFELDEAILEELTPEYCNGNVLAPVYDGRGVSRILLSDPANAGLRSELAFHLENRPEFAVAPTRVIRLLLSSAEVADKTEIETPDEVRQADRERVRQEEADGPVIRFVSEVFNEAVALGASDIHFESQEDGLRIRFRIHGLLRAQSVNRSLNPGSILARVKVMAAMNVSERRLPQDGRITANMAGRKVDFRVSSVPTSFGESIVCRVLDPKALRMGWDQLGFSAEITSHIIRVIEQPSGLFLVTGPTGSGKTTTLYTALSHLNTDDRKILTVEDPVEYNLSGIEQVQVHEEIGMTFAKALRSFLRQDPNVIMIGEIRDQETAEIACRAALVGRMVLSTLHTNSPQGAVTRLVDLGVPEYIVRDVLRGVLGQRLEVSSSGWALRAEFCSSF
ncbi:GspE/PulE family protein [Leisingera sp. ANG-M7]|uniref:GspE/PulE family protein n=1 Tax=Leisingera sp. ANG-M7 TaxID=1577902 RepID=UPI00068C77EB|nr:GspE/PulE family protein [Leisingera sp. ANG-M7]